MALPEGCPGGRLRYWASLLPEVEPGPLSCNASDNGKMASPRVRLRWKGRALFRKSEFRFCLDNFPDKLLWTEVAW